MIFGKHINRYYLKYGPVILLGLIALIAVDYVQLEIPELYGAIVNGMNNGFVLVDGVQAPFNMAYVLDGTAQPIVVMVLLFSATMKRPMALMCGLRTLQSLL